MSEPAPGAHLVAGIVDEGVTAAAARSSGQPLIDLGGDLVAHGAAGEVGGDLVYHTRPLREARLHGRSEERRVGKAAAAWRAPGVEEGRDPITEAAERRR